MVLCWGTLINVRLYDADESMHGFDLLSIVGLC